MRGAFIKTVTEMAREDEKIILVIGDTGYSVFEKFEAEFGPRFINVGIAEQSMVGFAAGLAMQGYKVFAYNVVSFMTLRAMEQIQLDVCYQENPVVLVGVGCGFNYGTAGPTHHALQDVAMMRTLPNMTVICPGDPFEMEAATRKAIELGTPCYIRISRSADPYVHNTMPDFEIGRAIKLCDGKDAAIFAAGGMLKEAVRVVELLENKGVEAELYSMHTVKPLDKEALLACANEGKAIFTMEEHALCGGLGSAVAEVLAENLNSKPVFKPFAFPNEFAPYAGTRDALHKLYGMNPESMANEIIGSLT